MMTCREQREMKARLSPMANAVLGAYWLDIRVNGKMTSFKSTPEARLTSLFIEHLTLTALPDLRR